MADFYSVLKTSIVRRDLRSPADRQEVYDQARKAMIRKLWSFDPPLAEEEIDTRIGLFDAAVERIEGDLEIAFAEADAVQGRRSMRRDARRPPSREPQRQPLVYEGYDEETDYAPAFGGSPAAREQDYDEPITHDRAEVEDEAPPDQPRYDDRWVEAEEPVEPRRDWSEPVDGTPSRRDYHEAEAEADRLAEDRGYFYEEAAYQEPAYSDEEEGPKPEPVYARTSYRQPAPRERAAPADRRRGRPQSRWEDPSQIAETGYDYEEAESGSAVARRGTKRSKAAGKGAKGGRLSSLVSRNPVRLLTITIAILSLLLIVFNAFVFLPIILGSDEKPPATVAPPQKIDDRLPAASETTGSATRIVSDSATASEIPERNVAVAESLVIFDGRDPTVFEGASDNPIQFDSDVDGGFARISSAASAAGSRALIGPGLAERLAGKTIRITLLARSSGENGAATMRFAYQSGLAISHWQSADLATTYGSYGMIWRVPAAHTGADYLLIEPGIPGDGTGTDIRSIKIDILAG